jgi:hypothetical protein
LETARSVRISCHPCKSFSSVDYSYFLYPVKYLYIIIQWFYNENQTRVIIANDTRPTDRLREEGMPNACK